MAPRFANSSAIPAPIPREPPVMIAIFEANGFSILARALIGLREQAGTCNGCYGTTVLLKELRKRQRYIHTGAPVDPGHPETRSGCMILGRYTGCDRYWSCRLGLGCCESESPTTLTRRRVSMKRAGYRVRMVLSGSIRVIRDYLVSSLDALLPQRGRATAVYVRSGSSFSAPIVVLLPKSSMPPFISQACFDQLTGSWRILGSNA